MLMLLHAYEAYDVIMLNLIDLQMGFQGFDVLPDLLVFGGLC